MEMIAFCEDRVARLENTVKRQARIEQQLREREEWEKGPADPPKQTIEELRAEMRARGFPMGGPQPHKETPATVMAKYGWSRAEFDAFPNGDLKRWQKLCDAHKPPRSLEQIVRDKGWTAEEPPITSKLLA
jgi:hypothetical protein